VLARRPERADFDELIGIKDISLQGQYTEQKVTIRIHERSNESSSCYRSFKAHAACGSAFKTIAGINGVSAAWPGLNILFVLGPCSPQRQECRPRWQPKRERMIAHAAPYLKLVIRKHPAFACRDRVAVVAHRGSTTFTWALHPVRAPATRADCRRPRGACD
jgi:hypothetical protein